MSTPKKRVFIADDHPLVRKGLAAMINAEPDMEVCGEAEDCASATAEIMKVRPDVAIIDISLKGNSGIELIKNVKAFDPGIHVLVVSMHDESVYAMRVLKAGAKAYVTKQDIANKVIDAIRKVQTGQMYFSEKVTQQMLNNIGRRGNPEVESPVAGLSDRELEVVNLIGGGLGTGEIASRLKVSVKTVETHRAHIKSKLNLATATQLVQFCVRWVEESRRQEAEASGGMG
jgi:DNA-binding NarL/FixJ family response regulator